VTSEARSAVLQMAARAQARLFGSGDGGAIGGRAARGVTSVMHESRVVGVGADVLAHLDRLLAPLAVSGVSRDERLSAKVIVLSGAEGELGVYQIGVCLGQQHLVGEGEFFAG
jgi:hypothetical protein